MTDRQEGPKRRRIKHIQWYLLLVWASVYFLVGMLSFDLYITFQTQVHISPFQTRALPFFFFFFCHSNFISSVTWTAGSAVTGVWSDSWDLLTVLYANGPSTWAAEQACRQFSYANLIDREHIAEEHTPAWDTGSYISLAKFPKKGRGGKKWNAKRFDAYSFQPLKCKRVYFSYVFATLWLNVANTVYCAVCWVNRRACFFLLLKKRKTEIEQERAGKKYPKLSGTVMSLHNRSVSWFEIIIQEKNGVNAVLKYN